MSGRGRSLTVATRGSELALRQAATVRDALEDRRFAVELLEVETTGDRVDDELIHRLGTTGAFVRSLDREVLDGEADLAVHSMKDVPTEQPDDLVVAGVPKRARPGDVLVTPGGSTLEELPEGATVGTSSLRRRAQLQSARSDLELAGLRGNVDTRVEKLLAPHLQREHERRLEAAGELTEDEDDDDGEADEADDAEADEAEPATEYDEDPQTWFDGLAEIERQALGREVEQQYDAIVLAAAGLDRAGLLHTVDAVHLPTDSFVPAPGQGALAVTAAAGTDVVEDVREILDHPRTRAEVTVERTILAELGGGCVAPLGVHAVLEGRVVRTTASVLARDGQESVEATRELPVEDHVEAAQAFAADLVDRGAADLVAAAKREAGAATEGDAATVGEAEE